MPAPPFIFIGIDGGGSKTEVLAAGEQLAPVLLQGPGVNVLRDGIEASARHLVGLIHEVLGQMPPVRVGGICAGLAGAGREPDRRHLAETLRGLLAQPLSDRPSPAAEASLCLVPDGRIALEAALGSESGLTVITGTGSIVLGRTRKGELVRAGGWGPLLGDDGGGIALGRSGLRAAAAALDGGPSTLLTDLLRDHHQMQSLDDLIRKVYQEQWALQHEPAHLVLEAAAQGDPVARGLLQQEIDHLALQVTWLLNREGHDAFRPCWAPMGGLSRHPHYRSVLTATLQQHLPGWSLAHPKQRPVEGALHLAQTLHP